MVEPGRRFVQFGRRHRVGEGRSLTLRRLGGIARGRGGSRPRDLVPVVSPGTQAGRGVSEMNARIAWSTSAACAGPHWYLATVGTRPDRRGEGLASRVIRAGLAACDQGGLPAAVETSNEANCRLYEHLGFRAAGDRTAPDGGLRVWVLVRPAQR